MFRYPWLGLQDAEIPTMGILSFPPVCAEVPDATMSTKYKYDQQHNEYSP